MITNSRTRVAIAGSGSDSHTAPIRTAAAGIPYTTAVDLILGNRVSAGPPHIQQPGGAIVAHARQQHAQRAGAQGSAPWIETERFRTGAERDRISGVEA